ncbi:MAG: hypothetical protein A4E63_02389 [Syntrophorhabdus sp. PtaU1.Bin050]|nr:MAG: hypothetical protein A4E63_02389 [Syntrophorhabdus sp. PtaU1.Bin050]
MKVNLNLDHGRKVLFAFELSERIPVTEEEMEIARLKREIVELRMERDILKNATAYFARESLKGTRS